MAEKLHEPLASTYKFLIRLGVSIAIGLLSILTALFIGMMGYHFFEDLPWVDAFVNAAMILSGMGQVNSLQTSEGKIFAGFYALFSGLVFIVIIGIMFAPIVHRFFHVMHTKNNVSKN